MTMLLRALAGLLIAAGCASAQSIEIQSLSPAPFENYADEQTVIEVEFDQLLDGAFLNDTTFVVRGSQSGPIAGSYGGAAGLTASFTPLEPYRSGETISYTLTTGLRSTDGNTLARGHSYSFRVASAPPEPGSVYSQRVITGTSSQGEDLRVMDYDFDGDLDVLHASEGLPEHIYVSEATGSHEYCTWPTGGNFRQLAVFDIDGDGDYDNFGATGSFDTELNWFENVDGPPFVERFITSRDPWTIAGGDLDSDGDIDVVSPTLIPNRVYWYANDGVGNFNGGAQIPSSFDGGSDSHFLVRDINGDGAMDILAFHRDNFDLVWYENDGAENFSEHLVHASDDRGRIECVDLDDDGDVDILWASTENSPAVFLAWFENDGSENFSYHPLTSVAGGKLFVIQAADLDGDMDMDLLAGGFKYLNDGSEIFTESPIGRGLGLGNSQYARGLDTADMDGDGDLDIGVQGLFAVSWYENGPALELLGTVPSHGASAAAANASIELLFSEAIDVSTAGAESIFILSDQRARVEGEFSLADGGTRVVFTPDEPYRPGECIEVSVHARLRSLAGKALEVNQGFSFTATAAETVDPAFTPHVIHSFSSNASGMDLADIDGDGDLDIAATSFNEVAWAENTGGAFTVHSDSSTYAPIGIHVVDMDQDNDMDFWVDNSSSNQGRAELWVNDGSQVFTPEDHSGSRNSFEISDQDRDGQLDNLWSSTFNERLYWNFGVCGGLGSYGLVQTLYAKDGISEDLSGDRVDDLLAATTVGTLALQDGDSKLFFFVDTVATLNAKALALGDLDQDGDLDPVVVETFNRVAWYPNESAGDSLAFGSGLEIGPLGSDPRDVALADLDGDGDLDVAAVTRNGDEVVWYMNRLNGPEADFGPQQGGPGIADGPILLRAGDLDGDGDMDLATLSDGDDRLIWWENTGTTTVREPAVATQPKSLRLHPAAPNPFNPTTTLRLEMPREGRADLSVYNTLGQRVRTLLDEHLPAGEAAITWDGLGSQGQALASGMYLVRLQAEGDVRVRKVVLLK